MGDILLMIIERVGLFIILLSLFPYIRILIWLLHNILIPPFVLQLLVENALCHAFPKKQLLCQIGIHVYAKQKVTCYFLPLFV
nr:hypothetical protein [Bacillus sp. 123MFChir2]